MRIDGKQIAENLLSTLTDTVARQKEQGIAPTLGVILVGDNPASLSYIKQKQKAAEKIGAVVKFLQFPATIPFETIKATIEQWNRDTSMHGIIIQRPLPPERSDLIPLLTMVKKEKDVDGFVPGSPFPVPVAAAIVKILETIYPLEAGNTHEATFDHWIQNHCTVVIGRGETAGKPIADEFEKRGCLLSIVHSQTTHPREVIKKANIVVSCVGKSRVVTADMITPGTILISVGIWRDTEDKLHGDYEEEEIGGVASYYTPTPGGVGPVNVACLMQNLVKAPTID